MSDIVKHQQNELIAGDSSIGIGNFDMSDFIMPRLTLLQGLSASVKAGEAKMGQFENTLTGDLMDPPITIIPLLPFKSASYFEEGGGDLICKSNDGKVSIEGKLCQECPYGEYHSRPWPKGGVPPKCKLYINFFVLLKNNDDWEPVPLIMSFYSTSMRAGKQLLTKAFFGDASRCYKAIEIGKDFGSKGQPIPRIGRLSPVDEDTKKLIDQWCDRLKSMGSSVNNHVDDDLPGNYVEEI